MEKNITMINWDEAYANAAYIPQGDEYPLRWAERAALFRQTLGERYRQTHYGSTSRQTIDWFYPEVDSPSLSKGLAVFVHGGYWMAFDPSYWSHLAAGALARGWVVAMPGYDLTPTVSLTQITQQIGVAIESAAAQIQGPICLAGHSAGGHLVTRMICDDSPLSRAVSMRIQRVVSISGLHDLRPLLQTRMNETLGLDWAQASAESPALKQALPQVSVTAWVGAEERPEFIRQTDLLANIWTGLGVSIQAIHAPKQHHFSVIDDLTQLRSALMQAWLGEPMCQDSVLHQ